MARKADIKLSSPFAGLGLMCRTDWWLLYYQSWCPSDKIRDVICLLVCFFFKLASITAPPAKECLVFLLLMTFWSFLFSFCPLCSPSLTPIACQLSILLINRRRLYLSLMLTPSVSLPLWEWKNPMVLQKEPWRLLMSSCSAFSSLVKLSLNIQDIE